MSLENDMKRINESMGWRYLDSLDSVRYSSKYTEKRIEPIPIRLIPARLDFMKTILWGHGISVSNNQLFDSVGFLRIASELINVASEFEDQNKMVFVPLRFALFDYGNPEITDPFQLTANRFESATFELSAWPTLDSNLRKHWANAIKNYEYYIPKEYIRGLNEQAEQLFEVLGYFHKHSEKIKPAVPTKGIREDLVRSVADLDLTTINSEKIFEDLDDEKKNVCLNIIEVFSNLKNIRDEKGKTIIDNRSKIRDALFNRQSECLEGTNLPEENFEIGVLRTLDGIYNISSAIGARGDQDSHSREMSSKVFRDEDIDIMGIIDRKWGVEESGFVLESWARIYAKDNFQAYGSGSIQSHDITRINPNLSITKFNTPKAHDIWRNFFEIYISDSWRTSITNYINVVKELEDVQQSYSKTLDEDKLKQQERNILDLKKAYSEVKYNHEELINQVLESFIRMENEKLVVKNNEGDQLGSSTTEDYSTDKELSDFVAEKAGDDNIKNNIIS